MEELPKLPKARYGHACSPIPTPGTNGQVASSVYPLFLSVYLFISSVYLCLSMFISVYLCLSLFICLSHFTFVYLCLSLFIQTLVVAGGSYGGREYTSSVVSLAPGATAWVEKQSLPRALFVPRASLVGGKMRLVGGRIKTEDPDDYRGFRDEVTITSN